MSTEMLPVHKRDFHVFLSHASTDKAAIVEPLFRWLTEVAGWRVWFDAAALSGGDQFGSELPKAIGQCRALLLMISKASLNSGWVQQEYQFALMHQNQFKDFRIIPVILDDSQPTGFMATVTHIKMAEFTLETAEALLKALSTFNPTLQAKMKYGRVRDVYVSRSWRDEPTEETFADTVSKAFAETDFRLIGDSRDQKVESKKRVTDIMKSCGGLLAILPERNDDPSHTSPYMIDEIHWAVEANLPFSVICSAESIVIPDALKEKAVNVVAVPAHAPPDVIDAAARKAAAQLSGAWREPARRQYVFFATDFDPEHQKRKAIIRDLIERVTAMPCLIGDEIEGAGSVSVQQTIVNMIREAQLVVADITAENLNTIYEAGIARGAGVTTLLISGDARHNPPYMLTDQQVFFFKDDVEMLGRVNKLIYPYRRRVLNTAK